MDTLIITLLAVVICMVVGIPLGIWMARSNGVEHRHAGPRHHADDAAVLLPGPARPALRHRLGGALVLTVIYALPPIVRITEHGIRSVSPTTQEAARSLGLTGGQMLRSVQLPMARRTIVVGINQRMMAALSMATIAALVNGPGLGKPVVAALQTPTSARPPSPGLAIVFMAIMLDRTTTAASERGTGRTTVGSASGMGVMLTTVVLERLPDGPPRSPAAGSGCRASRRRAAGCCWRRSSSRCSCACTSPDSSCGSPSPRTSVGPELTRMINEFTDWFVGDVDTFTFWIKDQVTTT